MRAETRDNLKGLAFVSPWLIGFALFMLVPICMSLVISFTDYKGMQSPLWIGLSNYRELATDEVFGKVLTTTGDYALLALPLGLGFALGCAMLLNMKIRGQSIYRTLIFLPSLVPAVAAAMIWLWLFNTDRGLLNYILGCIGIHAKPGWLTDPQLALPSLALMSFWGVGNTAVIFLAGLQDVPRELYEAADLDGAGQWGSLLHVTLPSISPVIFFNLIMGLIGTLNVLTLPLIMTQGGPARATYFYAMYLYDAAFKFVRLGYASAMAWVLLLIVLMLTGFAFWTSKRWVHYQD